MKLLQASVNIIEIICQGLGGSDKLLLGFIAAGIRRNTLQAIAEVIKNRRKTAAALIIKIILKHSRIIFLNGKLPVFAIVIPVFYVVKAVPHTLDGNGIHTCPCTPVGSKGSQCKVGLLGYLLTAVANRLRIGNIICGSI